jgi:benzoate-CoA ligase
VLEVAVIGAADAEGLTKTKAFAVLKPGAQATDAELKMFVKDKLAPYKYPRQIVFVAELPKTATGKFSVLGCVNKKPPIHTTQRRDYEITT